MPRKKAKVAERKREKLFPYCELRRQGDGSIQPWFKPGPRERTLGFVPVALKHADGSWFSLDEVAQYAVAKRAEILAARQGDPKKPPIAPRRTLASRSVADLLKGYFTSQTFRDKRASTQRMYLSAGDAIRFQPRLTKKLKHNVAPRVPEDFAVMPAARITSPKVRGFYDHLVKVRGATTARGIIMVLSAAYDWAKNAPGWEIRPNPCHDLDLPSPAARLVVWTMEEAQAMVAAADAAGKPSIGDAIIVGLFSGQREGDILDLVDEPGANRSLAERVADGEPIRVVQSKTGARVAVFAAPALVKRLQEAEERRKVPGVVTIGPVPIVRSEASGKAWNKHTFQHDFADLRPIAAEAVPSILHKRDAKTKQDVGPLHFQDLRDTAVTWLARAGCTLPEICSITGHSPQSATMIMKAYLELGEEIARGANKKLVAWMSEQGMAL